MCRYEGQAYNMHSDNRTPRLRGTNRYPYTKIYIKNSDIKWSSQPSYLSYEPANWQFIIMLVIILSTCLPAANGVPSIYDV